MFCELQLGDFVDEVGFLIISFVLIFCAMDAPLSFGYVAAALAMSSLFQNIVKVSVELVVDAANLASTSRPFEVVYHPRASTFEFYVKTSTVKATMRIQWSPKMRLKMASETKVSPQISWFMCTISLDDVKGQYRWSNSPWRLLEVAWDEPDLLQNVKWVRPWLVELVLYVPLIHILPSSPPS
ncbi:putative auxin response factor domain-containing protein [Helianthus annuus]|nr:putative auxin response factor domain-containing protein [Helianthus annuus]KAJ0459784.1 putative auxin response factor domain-containing protein [Helianthus annuus]KAJ0626626.1 putative auxin response factor domain-containing protein [Helianthus annuus]KAJ0758004.1 putative auxin response factor domain-containing protein [Helianthus annuus]KAJ0902799.1 putative auxin response factor [Helianthus annuus]